MPLSWPMSAPDRNTGLSGYLPTMPTDVAEHCIIPVITVITGYNTSPDMVEKRNLLP
jgi:hypothetical protein